MSAYNRSRYHSFLYFRRFGATFVGYLSRTDRSSLISNEALSVDFVAHIKDFSHSKPLCVPRPYLLRVPVLPVPVHLRCRRVIVRVIGPLSAADAVFILPGVRPGETLESGLSLFQMQAECAEDTPGTVAARAAQPPCDFSVFVLGRPVHSVPVCANHLPIDACDFKVVKDDVLEDILLRPDGKRLGFFVTPFVDVAPVLDPRLLAEPAFLRQRTEHRVYLVF